MAKSLRIQSVVLKGMAVLLLTMTSHAFAQPGMRRHTAQQQRTLELVPATQKLSLRNQVVIEQHGDVRVIQTNGIPDHLVGIFPNRGNPHSIEERPTTLRVTMNPQQNRRPRPVGMDNFGVAVNGILFDPGAAEFWLGQRGTQWQYEALGGAVPLGLDANFAHVQPDGKYHYHAIPTALFESRSGAAGTHSPLIGWAADGFPIYVQAGYSTPDNPESAITTLRSSYRLKSGVRPGGIRGTAAAPGGRYDGTFVTDYEFVAGSGDLDECNGRYCVTPEFPDGTYAYFLTADWPVIPRMFRGTPDPSFQKRPGPPTGWGFRPPASGRRGLPPRR